ncbi:hypothetical protein MAMMFC1_04259 [Methylomusa anaerophila]|uniref:Uncharacterized protein n=2 Tax=Methylomusa anaerophila TaxID=1930071 RepID=A0A348AR43_9FIRM|nr:hypothetical protein MAMMFC1_04259 [Methylomusa anaerophila]
MNVFAMISKEIFDEITEKADLSTNNPAYAESSEKLSQLYQKLQETLLEEFRKDQVELDSRYGARQAASGRGYFGLGFAAGIRFIIQCLQGRM